jgi:hypothetical protein
MRFGRRVWLTGAIGLALLVLLPQVSASRPGAEAAAQVAPPRLAVLLIFDQFRGDYLTRWDGLYEEGGFHRLEKDGAWFQECHYPYAHTVTGAGHASLATGCSPQRHGIISNEWYERSLAATVYCATEERYERVPPLRMLPKPEPKDPEEKEEKGEKKLKGSGSPGRLLAGTLADALKEATGGRARVVSLSMKDRGAAFLGGKRPDACYWFDTTDGQFVTSTYYRDAPHPWVTALNRPAAADRWFNRPWERLRPELNYEKYSGPDDVAGEWKGYGQGRVFPHPMDGGLKAPHKNYYEALYNSPFGNDLLLELVKQAVDAEKLGSRDVPDLLCVSFSCNDPLGHCWGPDSQEVLDAALRTDRLVKALLAHLDARVGPGGYLVVLSADHGVCPLPEVSRAQGREALRIPAKALKAAMETFLHKTFPGEGEPGEAVAALLEDSIYLNPGWLRARRAEKALVEETLARWLEKQAGIQAAYTRTQLLAGQRLDDAIGRRVQKTFHAERSGDVLFVVKPWCLLTDRLAGTLHGTPHPYDTHVPLLVSGPGVVPGVRREAVTPQAAVAILARGLGIKPPATAEAEVPKGLLRN